MFEARFVLAATLSSNYGIYGPAFELGVNTPRERGSEEYLDSEKYEQKLWDLDDPASLAGLITIVNRARRGHPARRRREAFEQTRRGAGATRHARRSASRSPDTSVPAQRYAIRRGLRRWRSLRHAPASSCRLSRQRTATVREERRAAAPVRRSPAYRLQPIY